MMRRRVVVETRQSSRLIKSGPGYILEGLTTKTKDRDKEGQ